MFKQYRYFEPQNLLVDLIDFQHMEPEKCCSGTDLLSHESSIGNVVASAPPLVPFPDNLSDIPICKSVVFSFLPGY